MSYITIKLDLPNVSISLQYNGCVYTPSEYFIRLIKCDVEYAVKRNTYPSVCLSSPGQRLFCYDDDGMFSYILTDDDFIYIVSQIRDFFYNVYFNTEEDSIPPEINLFINEFL